MKKIFKSFVSMSLVLMCASSLFAQQSASDSTRDTPAVPAPQTPAQTSQQTPPDSVVSTPTTTSTPVPDAQPVAPAQTSQPVTTPAPTTAPIPAAEPEPEPAAAAAPHAHSHSDDEALQPIQKDDKKSLTVMTSDIPGKDIDKKDWLSEAFTPVGDFTYDVIKTTSDALGGFCDGCVNAFDGFTKFVLTPFGFKEEPKEKRSYTVKE